MSAGIEHPKVIAYSVEALKEGREVFDLARFEDRIVCLPAVAVGYRMGKGRWMATNCGSGSHKIGFRLLDKATGNLRTSECKEHIACSRQEQTQDARRVERERGGFV